MKRWYDEYKEKRDTEMEVFSGKRDANVNDGETASTVSQSKMSNKVEKA